jgi:hypothetical protein
MITAAASVPVLAACVQMQVGPSIAVMPAPNKPFEVFQQDDQLCRGWAAHSIGIPGNEVAAQTILASTVAGAVIGAVAGAVVGGDRGAGAGAAMGTVVGATQGTGQVGFTAFDTQRRYDIAYQQCMYAKGNIVPAHVYGGYYYPQSMPATPPPPLPR